MRFSPAFATSIGAIAALAVGVSAFAAWEPRAGASRSQGPALQIALVAAEEPEIQAGAVMDVGELQDGYKHRPYIQAAHSPREAWVDESWDEPAPTVRSDWEPAARDIREAAVELIEGVRERPLSFGFDRARSDFAEQRRHRREAMERREMEYRVQPAADREVVPESRYAAPAPWRRAETVERPAAPVEDAFY